MKSKVAAVLVLLLSVALLAAACGSNNEPSSGGSSATGSEGGTVTIGSDQANNHGEKDVSGMDELEVEQDNFYFEPTQLKGTAGQTLKIELKNESTTEHNFSIDDQNIDQDVEGGEDATVTVTFPSSGSVEFYCKYHRGSGMAGQLTVSA
jgi:plastocyanin